MRKSKQHAQVEAQELIIKSKCIEISELEKKVRFQNRLIADLKAELKIKNNEIKSFLRCQDEI